MENDEKNEKKNGCMSKKLLQVVMAAVITTSTVISLGDGINAYAAADNGNASAYTYEMNKVSILDSYGDLETAAVEWSSVKNATVLYVTADNVNKITADVITNSKGTKTKCTGLVDILAKRQKGYDKTPLIIRMVGEIKGSDIEGLNSNGYLQIKGCYNTTYDQN